MAFTALFFRARLHSMVDLPSLGNTRCSSTHKKTVMRFSRSLLWSMSALVMIGVCAVGASSEWRARIKSIVASETCDNIPCFHLSVRRRVIESVIAQRGQIPSYLMIGDSITEMAELPSICGRLPINAGIGAATTKTFRTEAARFAELSKPDFVIVALGGNDALTGQFEGFRERYDALSKSLQPKRVIVIPVPPSSGIPNIQRINDEIAALRVPKAGTLERVETIDGIHLAASSYIEWKQHIIDAAQAFACG